MVVPCAVLPTDCSGWPASCFNGECYSTPTMVRQQRRRSQRSLSSTGTDIPSSRPTFGRAPRASAVRKAAQRHWRQPARNVLDSGSTVLRSTGREETPHASKRRCFAKHSNLITGRKSHEVRRSYASFRYQAQSWSCSRRVVAKVEWHPGELYPRVGFLVTNLCRPPERVVAFYNGRGTAEQWIKEGKNAIRW